MLKHMLYIMYDEEDFGDVKFGMFIIRYAKLGEATREALEKELVRGWKPKLQKTFSNPKMEY